MKEWICSYVDSQKVLLDKFPVLKIEEIIETFKMANIENRQIFVFGNGGSASSASHFITDLGKSVEGQGIRKFNCRAMNESNSWMTAIGNDFSYEDLFCKQLENFAKPGDLVFVMSVSGNSPNILKATKWSKNNGLFVIALVGQKDTPLYEIADLVVSIPEGHYGRVEDAHMFICHVIAYAFIENPDLVRQQCLLTNS